jgi:replicative DNA helicase
VTNKKNTKLPPQDLESESSVLGALMLDKNAILKVTDILEPDDFYHPSHQKIFRVILDLFKNSSPIDLLTVTNKLKKEKQLKEIGGSDYLTELINKVPTSAHISHYAKIVKENKIRRDLINASSDINEDAIKNTDFENLLDAVEQKIFKISQRSRTQKFTHLKEELPQAYERLEKLHQGEKENILRGVPSGFPQLDKMLAGFQKSDLLLLGARPSIGKTSLALDIARNAALKNYKVGIFSLEMSAEQVVDRIIAAQSQIPLWRLRTGRIQNETEFAMIQQALSVLSDISLFIEDSPSPNILHIRSMARKLQLEHGLDLLIIDYLQLITPRTGSNSIVQQITEISRSLKSLARELEVPVLALSQLSRSVEQREIKIPRLSDLRESGCLRGSSQIQLANGTKKTIKEMAERKKQTPLKVIGLDKDYKLKTFTLKKAFSSGIKKVYKLTTKSRREIYASGNHPFLKINGWEHLDELGVGDQIAIPRKIPTNKNKSDSLSQEELILHAHLIGDGCILPTQPYHYTNAYKENIETVRKVAKKLFDINGRIIKQKNWFHLYLKSPYHLTHNKKHPITNWYEKLGIKRERSYKKEVSFKVFECNDKKIALFLKHIWATDGNLSWKKLEGRIPAGNIYYASSSKKLAKQIQSLLLRIEIQSTIVHAKKRGYRKMFHVVIQGSYNQIKFLKKVGIADRRQKEIPKIMKSLQKIVSNPNNDVLPKEIWKVFIEPAKNEAGITWREFSKKINTAYCGTSLFKNGLSRERMMRVSTALKPELKRKTSIALEISQTLENLAKSDIYWDKIASIELQGEEEVYDVTVEGAHNFIANDIIVHNSLEQDSDVVMFIYRKNQGKLDISDEERNITDIIIAKHRNGPLGAIKLNFDPERVSFRTLDTHHEEE